MTDDTAVEETVVEEEFAGLVDKESDISSAHGIANGEGITVAVIDDGLDYTHEFLNGKIADGAWDFYNDTEYKYEYECEYK